MKLFGSPMFKLFSIALVLVLLAVSVVGAAPVEKPAALPGQAVVGVKAFYAFHAYDDYNLMINGSMYPQTNGDGTPVLVSLTPGVQYTIVVLSCSTEVPPVNLTVTADPGSKMILDFQLSGPSSCE